MISFVGYLVPVLMIACPLSPAQTQDAKGHQDDSATIKQRGIQITEGALKGISVPWYRSLSNPYPSAKKPLAPGGWFLEVRVIGGLTGGRKEYILITSEGDIAVQTLDEYRNLSLPESVVELDALIKRAQPAQWSATGTKEQTVNLCQECYKTTFTLYRRNGDELQTGYQAGWDEATRARVILEVGEITREVEKVKQRALRPQ